MERSQIDRDGLSAAEHASSVEADYDDLSVYFNDALGKDDGGNEVRSALSRGIAVYYVDENTPHGCIIKEYPDGRMELVSFASGIEQRVEYQL